MTYKYSLKQLRKKFKGMYEEEFNDPNEAFMDFMLELIPKGKLKEIIKKGNRYYYSMLKNYK